MPQSRTLRILSLAALAIGTSLFAHAQESAETEEIPIEVDDTTISGGKTCYVSKVRFTNDGSYDLFLFSVNGSDLPAENLLPGQSRTWQLKKTDLEDGDAFYLRYRIDLGNKLKSKNCKKDGTTLIYHPDGNTWSHWSKGTT